MEDTIFRTGLMSGIAMTIFGTVPAQAGDDDDATRHRSMLRAKRHEAHREMMRRMAHREQHREMQRRMLYRTARTGLDG